MLGKFEPHSGLRVSKKQKFLPCSFIKIQYYGEPPRPRGSVLGLRPPGLEFRILCWRAVSSHSSHHSQEVILARFSLYVHKGGMHFITTKQNDPTPQTCVRSKGWKMKYIPLFQRADDFGHIELLILGIIMIVELLMSDIWNFWFQPL